MAVMSDKLVQLFKMLKSESGKAIDELLNLGLVDRRTGMGYKSQLEAIALEENPLRSGNTQMQLMQELAGHIGFYVGENETFDPNGKLKPGNVQPTYESVGVKYLNQKA